MRQYSSTDIQKGMRKLTTKLDRITALHNTEIVEVPEDGLSLMVDEALKGVDIRTRYPSFYHRMTKNAELRQQFLDAITQDADGKTSRKHLKLGLEQLEAELIHAVAFKCTQVRLSIESLTAIFFPQNLAYRSVNAMDTPQYLLLDEKIRLDPVTYSILVDGSLSENSADFFSLAINLALEENLQSDKPALPIELLIRWGEYSTQLQLPIEGQYALTDVPIHAFLDDEHQAVNAPLEITLSRSW